MERGTKVKICGITNHEDANFAAELGADMIGINFYPGSKRFVSPEKAAAFVDRISGITKIGVFVNASIEDILFAVKLVRLDGIQLHGRESFGFIAELKSRIPAMVIKAIRVRSAADMASLEGFGADAVLLDTFSVADYGGTGETFDWTLAQGYSKIDRIFLAGGLNADNVAEAIRIVRPYAVDVASGVESSPNKKDPKKLESFIKNAKRA